MHVIPNQFLNINNKLQRLSKLYLALKDSNANPPWQFILKEKKDAWKRTHLFVKANQMVVLGVLQNKRNSKFDVHKLHYIEG